MYFKSWLCGGKAEMIWHGCRGLRSNWNQASLKFIFSARQNGKSVIFVIFFNPVGNRGNHFIVLFFSRRFTEVPLFAPEVEVICPYWWKWLSHKCHLFINKAFACIPMQLCREKCWKKRKSSFQWNEASVRITIRGELRRWRPVLVSLNSSVCPREMFERWMSLVWCVLLLFLFLYEGLRLKVWSGRYSDSLPQPQAHEGRVLKSSCPAGNLIQVWPRTTSINSPPARWFTAT